MAGIGDNSVVRDDLDDMFERAEACVERRKQANSDLKDIVSEAKAKGYDGTVFRLALRERAIEVEARQLKRELLDLYLGDLA